MNALSVVDERLNEIAHEDTTVTFLEKGKLIGTKTFSVEDMHADHKTKYLRVDQYEFLDRLGMNISLDDKMKLIDTCDLFVYPTSEQVDMRTIFISNMLGKTNKKGLLCTQEQFEDALKKNPKFEDLATIYSALYTQVMLRERL
jgi:hypothetical protein